MEIKVVLDEGAKLPTKAHESDAGFDLYSREDWNLFSGDAHSFDTGVHVAIPEGYVGFIKSKSGLNVREGIQAEGVIDSGYTGSIVVKMYNNGKAAHLFRKGDKLTQLVILPIPQVTLEQVDSLEETERGDNGFGSSGK